MEAIFVVALFGLMSLSVTKATKCNGQEGICDLKFNQATFAGTHNSGANKMLKYNLKLIMFPAGSCWYRNQDLTFTKQLDFGIRFFDIDTCKKDGEAWACHSDAFGNSVSHILNEISTWLNKPEHKNEVVVMRFHDTTIKGFDMFKPHLENYFSGADGGVQMNPMKNGDWYDWPTLGEAVAENKRVFVFMVYKLCDNACQTIHPYIRPSTYDDSWMERSLTFSCSSMVEETRAKCKNHYRELSIVSAFASVGLCNTGLQSKCNPYIRGSALACYEEREKKGLNVNFVIADYVNRASSKDSVVTVARELNEMNMKRYLH